jgi:hypothetical protein
VAIQSHKLRPLREALDRHASLIGTCIFRRDDEVEKAGNVPGLLEFQALTPFSASLLAAWSKPFNSPA